ncbi:MAG: InlB B-repeat-containing protein [Clostridia bacterium]|nr:InlB B-repeat-containing protein [Clostridia bacterium]
MKNTFKKAVSVLLAVIMVASLCTMAITTVSAEETTTFKDHGIYSGSYAEDRFLVENPDDPSEIVIKMPYGNGRYNYRLADPADLSMPFVVEKDKFYTITFDYRVDSVGNDETNLGFELYYGLTDTGGHGRKPASAKKSWAIYDIEGGNIDGVWRTAAIHFKANPYQVTEDVVTGQDPETGADIVDTNVIATLNNIYVTFYNSVGAEGYLKNFNIVEETDAGDNTLVDVTTDMKKTIDHTIGNASAYGSGMAGKLDEVTGNLVLSGGNSAAFATGGSAWVRHRCVVDNGGNRVAIYAGNSYTFALKYRVVTNSDWVTVGVGYAKSGVSDTSKESFAVKAEKTTGGETTEWRYLTGTFTPELNDGVTVAYPRIILSSAATTDAIEIESFAIAGSSMANVVTNLYNDNGDNITVKTGYKGTSVVVDGDKSAYNVEAGEWFMGWYADPNFNTALGDTVPTQSGTVYAKYPSTVIDFNQRGSYTKNYGHNITSATVDSVKGTLTAVGINTVGFMIPSYDADISDTDKSAFYQFKDGAKYKITFVIDSNDKQFTTIYTCADFAGSAGSRKTGSDAAHGHSIIPVIESATTISHTFNFKLAAAGYNGIDFRGDNTSISATVVFDKIIITEILNDAFVDGGLKSTVTLDYNDGVTEDETITVGYYDVKELPVPTREGYIFAGWYKNYRTTAHQIDTDDIPVSALAGHMGNYDATYVAQWVSTAVNRVEFSEGAYSNLGGGDKGGAFTIINDSAIDAESADHTYAMMDTVTTNKANNVYKVSLFNDDGSRMLAYEGVTYRFTVRYKIVDDRGSNGLQIGVARSGIGSYGPEGLDGVGSISVVATSKNTDGFVTATADFKVKGIYIADMGITESVTDKVQSQLALRMNSGIAFIDYVEVTAVSYTPAYANFIENATVTVDYENLTFTVIPDEGYEMMLGTAISKTTYLDYTIAEDPANSNKETCYPVDTDVNFYSDLYAENDGYTYGFYYDVAEGDRLSSIAFMAEMVEKGTTVNADIIAMSIREEKAAADNDGVYQSAGIRFRARISDSTLAGATEIGYVFAPTNALIEANTISMEDYLALDGNVAVKGIAKAANTDVIYEKLGENYTDYQAVLTGLTNEAGTKDLTDLEISVAFYVTGENGTTYFQYDSVKFSDLQ